MVNFQVDIQLVEPRPAEFLDFLCSAQTCTICVMFLLTVSVDPVDPVDASGSDLVATKPTI